MFQRIAVLKEKNYYPDLILDIGAYKGHWTEAMMEIYPVDQYMLFEAINYTDLNRFKDNKNVKHFNVILNEQKSEVDWYEKQNTGDSMFKELTYHFADCIPSKKQGIDLNTFALHNQLHIESFNNVFIKIDCQGAEIPILKGGSNLLEKTDFILLELPLFGKYNQDVLSFSEHIKYMDSIGFVPFDIIESHYINNFNMQIDMLFINKKHSFNNMVNQLLLQNS
jgi:FkbM family methyltransferase